MHLLVGIDWGARVHSVCVLDAHGNRLVQQEVNHEGEAVHAFVQQLAGLVDGDFGRVRVSMESPHGTMLEALMDAGAAGFHINPKQLDRFRDRHTVAGAKDDALDAFVLADSLRTDQQLFRPVPNPSEFLQHLRAENQTAIQLMEHNLAVANQVRELLLRYFPQMRDLGNWHDEPWLWDLLAKAPTPASVANLPLKTVQKILKARRIRRYSAKQVLDRLRSKPVPVGPGVAAACSQSALSLLPLLHTIHAQRKLCLKRIDAMLEQPITEEKEQGNELGGQTAESESHGAMLRDAVLLQTLPGLGRRTVTSVLARAHIALLARDYTSLRRLAGTAPVSRRTGGRAKTPMVAMRRARDPQLATAVHLWAWAACRIDPKVKARYAALRAKGHNHPRALRGVADRLLYLAIGVLKSGRAYEPPKAA